MSGFANVIGRLFRRHTAESTPAPKKGGWHPGQVQAFKDYGASGPVAAVPPFSPREATFEGMVGFENLCLIARAADNLHAELDRLGKVEQLWVISKDGDNDSAAFVCGALTELGEALIPYRTAREQYRR